MSENRTDIRYISTAKLIEQVVSESDRSALNELLKNRRLFFFNKNRLLLSEFLWLLRNRLFRKSGQTSDDLADYSYDLALEKFSNLPEPSKFKENNKSDQKLERKQVDCRYYYRAVLSIMNKWKENNPKSSTMEEERVIGDILQRLVIKHFNLSRLEYLRHKREFSTCYNWNVGDKIVKLWYPIELGIKAFREWLDNDKSDEITDISSERNRLQSRIDSHFFNKHVISIDEYSVAAPNPGNTIIPETHEVPKLAKIVAAEKIKHFDKLRPAIRKLGEPALKQLIIRVFEDLSDEVFEDQQIAGDFGLSKATFSRFAGSQWKDKLQDNKAASIPDLWHNTARVLGSNQIWLEIAEQAGVIGILKRVFMQNKNEVSDE